MENRRQLNKVIGDMGEKAAAEFLHEKGYRILLRNYRCKAGEIDIIAEQDNRIVFVEVKTRSPRAWLSPAEAVDAEKRRRVAKAAKYYLSSFRDAGTPRFDVVSVFVDEKDSVTGIHLDQDAFGS